MISEGGVIVAISVIYVLRLIYNYLPLICLLPMRKYGTIDKSNSAAAVAEFKFSYHKITHK